MTRSPTARRCIEKTTMSARNVTVSKGLPYGQGERKAWPGGTATIRVTGEFRNAGGVSTIAELHYQGRKSTDDSLEKPLVLKTFTEPGEYDVNIPPGECWTHSSGPSGVPLSVECEFSEPDAKHAPKVPTLEQRVKALEDAGRGAG